MLNQLSFPPFLCQGREFATVIAGQLLGSFTANFAHALTVSMSHNLRDFHGFAYELVRVIRGAVKPMLAQCKWVHVPRNSAETQHFFFGCLRPWSTVQATRGVSAAAVVTSGSSLISVVDLDELAVLANLRVLAQTAADASEYLCATSLARLLSVLVCADLKFLLPFSDCCG